jgi:hypothetical protein
MGGLIWLASYPKSGNTWTRAFLHNFIRQGEDTHDINDMTSLTNTDNAPGWYKDFIDKPLEQWTPEDVAQARPKAHKLIHDTSDGYVFLKSHSALVAHAGVPMITMSLTAGAIYIVRNPLDVAISYSHHMDESLDETISIMAHSGRHIGTHEKGVFQVMGSWSENVASWTHRPTPTLFVMRYEDMLAHPLDVFGELAGWLNLPDEAGRLEKAVELSSFDRLKEQEAKAGFKEKPKSAEKFFREGRAGQWKELLSRNQIRRIMADHGEQMARFGYLQEAEAFLGGGRTAAPAGAAGFRPR